MLPEVFRNTVSAHDLCRKSHRILVATSGGKDSMALLHLFHEEGYEVEAAHANFQLRGQDSDEDEKLVADFCRGRHIPFHSQGFDTKTFAKQHGISTQMAARELRYAWFEQVADARGLDRIATAHHLGDNIETLLLNFTRGTGPRGLTGIPVKTGRVIRPLLQARPGQIADYLITHSIPWREDRSNAEDHYHRNRIRNRVIPELERINPGLAQTFSVNLQRFYELEAIFDDSLKKFTATHLFDDGKTRIPHTALADTPPVVLEEFLKPFGFNRQDALTVLKIAETGKKILSTTHQLIRERDHWSLAEHATHEPDVPVTIHGEGIYRAGPYRLEVLVQEVAAPDFTRNTTAWLDAEQVSWPLRMRPWKTGDRFRPYGMKGSKLISDYLKDSKISAENKQAHWVLEDPSKIVWLVGHRVADHCKITDKTRKFLCLELREA